MNFLRAIQQFNPNSLKSTLIEVRNTDGSVTVVNKFGQVVENLEQQESQRQFHSEPNFSNYGFILNPNPDLQIGKITLNDGFKILFGSADVAKNLNLLQTNAVTHIINLVSNCIPNYFPEIFKYLSLIVYDNLVFKLRDTIYQCCDFINLIRRTENNACCFIHCDAGICRAPTIVIAYLIKNEDYSYNEAYELVNNTRNVTINFNFKSQLKAMG